MNIAERDWAETNQAALAGELARLRHRLEAALQEANGESVPEDLSEPVEIGTTPSAAIDLVCEAFGLSRFERELLLLCCGVEFDSGIGMVCARFNGSESQRNPTFGMALTALPDAHWSALTQARPLRRWRLIEIGAGLRLTDSPLCVDERILHFIAGINIVDGRLRPLLTTKTVPSLMSDAHAVLADQIAERLSTDTDRMSLIHLDGDDTYGQSDVAAAAAMRLGMHLFALRGDDLPAAGSEAEQFQALWEREARLLPALLFVQVTDTTSTPALVRFMDAVQAPLIVASREPLKLQRSSATYSVDKPSLAEQKLLWRRAIGPAAGKTDGELDTLAGQFRFSARTIASIVEGAAAERSDIGGDLWQACRRTGRRRLDDLAERIRSDAGWDDLVLPTAQLNTLHQVAAHLRQRIRVYDEWGFARGDARGLGISALFSGESGTGKTLAAEVLAAELGLDLYRIDLSSVVSKYIGETEKNLRRVFDAAEDSGAILLFDEADALFGKRSEVKDSHDRYANIEISYLLQRMEAYRGLAILTTNMKTALDRAFQRRLRFVVNFPFPDAALREAIWRRMFPARAPLNGIDYARLARLSVPGGDIRSIALNAAFLAADGQLPISMTHLLRAAQAESGKQDRPMSDAETRGWS